MGKLKPGMSQLGHPPFSNVKLEGPKVHHDDHGPNASVPKKGDGRAIPNEHWEVQYDPTVHKDSRTTRGSEFSPKRSSDRMTTYVKTNKEDH